MSEIKTTLNLVQKYLKRVSEDAQEDWKKDSMSRASLLFNLQYLSQATINSASLVLKKKGFAKPKATKDILDTLLRGQLLDAELVTALKKMVGFITLAAHNKTSLNVEILESMVNYELHFFNDFCKHIIQLELE